MGRNEYAAHVVAHMTGKKEHGRKHISSRCQTWKMRLTCRLEEATLEPGDIAKLQLLDMKLPVSEEDLDKGKRAAWSQQSQAALKQAAADDEAAIEIILWNDAIRAKHLTQLEQIIADPNYKGDKSIEERTALVLKQTFFSSLSESAGDLSHLLQPVWNAMFHVLKQGWSGSALRQLMTAAWDLQAQGWGEGEEDYLSDDQSDEEEPQESST